MNSTVKLIAVALVAALTTQLVACGGASQAQDYADELQASVPSSATHGSTLADLPDEGRSP